MIRFCHFDLLHAAINPNDLAGAFAQGREQFAVLGPLIIQHPKFSLVSIGDITARKYSDEKSDERPKFAYNSFYYFPMNLTHIEQIVRFKVRNAP